ncbi:MAG: alpha-amylase family glycosyl hydrolase [Anaerolineales bacterium]
MEEIIFGTHATRDLRLIYRTATHSGLQHRCALSPLDPLPGQPVTLTVEVGPDLPAEHIAAYFTSNGSEPAGARGVPRNGAAVAFHRAGTNWDTLLWGYRTRWEAVLPPQPEGALVRYRIGAWSAGASEVFADWPDSKATGEEAAKAFYRHEPLPFDFKGGDPSLGHLFAYRVDRLRPPAWARQAVVYHIFVDRFHPGDRGRWIQTADLQRLCGGTLWGVLDRIDYIAGLGATCLWLSPIFPSPSAHGYDATDTGHVEPRLGGDEALRALVAAAHARGMRLILDLVCNHVSDQHPFFREALASPAGPYRKWFRFEDTGAGYRSYFGVRTMPEVNLDHAPAREWMVDAGRYWLREFDVDGYRLDYATGAGPAFWSEFWGACKAERPDSFCFGEVVEPSDVQRTYLGRMDGLLDFQFAYGVRRTFADRSWSEAKFDHFMAGHHAYFPEVDFPLLTVLDNHDMDRFLFAAGDDKEALRRAARLQMQMPGPPVLYYGTEVGMSQAASKASRPGTEPSRAPMVWGAGQDLALLEFYRDLIQERLRSRPWERRPATSGER